MKVTDYIVNFIIDKNIKDVFGYPGGMVTHLIESIRLKSDKLNNHLLYHEQALAFAGCSYTELTKKPTICYATSGPGATNLITGIANAYFDSLPVIFITGQVNRNESSREMSLKQRGFQETDIVSMVKGITKFAVYCDDENKIPEILSKAYDIAMTDRKGPVLLDIPMDVQRSDIQVLRCPSLKEQTEKEIKLPDFTNYRRPVLLLGNALKLNTNLEYVRKVIHKLNIPVVTSMISFDILPRHDDLNYGFIGAYGNRYSNFILAKADLVICIGTRLDIRQVGINRENFAPNAQIVRFDIDDTELSYIIREDDIKICCPCEKALHCLESVSFDSSEWKRVCREIKQKLLNVDSKTKVEDIFDFINKVLPNDAIVTTDVGQNQVWVAQFLNNVDNFVLFSGNLGSMGYSLPSSIGAAYACPEKTVISFNGDGGIQMNIQELQTIFRDKLNIKIFIFNNHALGMIRHFQEMYFQSKYLSTTENDGFTVPNFAKIASAYAIPSKRILKYEDILKIDLSKEGPELIEIDMPFDTYVFPKLRFGCPNQDQDPPIDRELYNYLMSL